MTDSSRPPGKDSLPDILEVDEGAEQNTEASLSSRPLSRLFPANVAVWHEAYRLASQRNSRVEDVALCILQDPALVLEALRAANALFVVDGRPPTTTINAAIVRLGSELLRETLQKVSERHPIDDRSVAQAFEAQRARCRRTGIISRMLAEVLAKGIVDECHTAAVFSAVGDMLAVLHLQHDFLKLLKLKNQATINYRLSQDYRFDVEKMRVLYLKKQGVPDLLTFAVDRDGFSKSKERSIMKPICFAAMEFNDTFDAVKWEKLAPGRPIPAKSAIKTLYLSDSQYLRLYEKISEYLFLEKSIQEQNEVLGSSAPVEVERLDISTPPETTSPRPLSDSELIPQSEQHVDPVQEEAQIQLLDNDIFALLEEAELAPPPPPPPSFKPSPQLWEKPSAPPVSSPASPSPSFPPHVPPPVTPPSRKVQAARESILKDVGNIIEAATNSHDLLSSILDLLITSSGSQGPFEKSALIVVAADRKTATVVASRGPLITKGEVLLLEDPLSPLAQCFSKVQSFGVQKNASSPWGSKAFALAPLKSNHDTPVALYADCGEDGKLPFDARRVFRNVVEILNSKLPTLPGGIPSDGDSESP